MADDPQKIRQRVRELLVRTGGIRDSEVLLREAAKWIVEVETLSDERVEGNDRMHRALGQAKDRQLLGLERRLTLITEAASGDRPYEDRIAAIRALADRSRPLPPNS